MTIRKLMLASGLFLSLILASFVSAQPVTTEDIYISASASGTAGSVSFADEDIVRCDRSGGPGSCIWDLFFDGSAEGVAPSADLTAFHVEDDDNILLAFKTPRRIGNLGKVDDSDIVHFDRLAAPENAYSFFLVGGGVGLHTDSEAIDAMGFAPDGRLVISTAGNYSVPKTGGGTLSGGDEDLIVFNIDEPPPEGVGGYDTPGHWELFFDGSAVGLNRPQEDVWGAWIDEVSNEIYLTTRGAFSVDSLTGDGTEIFVCDPLNVDPISACATVNGFFASALEGLDDKIIDGIFIFNNSPPEITSDGGGATAAVDVDENTTAVTDVQSTDDNDSEGAGLAYSMTTDAGGGVDNAFFSLDSNTGFLDFLAAPDFENPSDSDTDNDYEVQVTVTDLGGLTDTQDITVTVVNINEPPEITSDGGGDTAALSVDENTTAVTDVETTDPEDSEGAGLSYSLTGGADSAKFGIDANSGVLAFIAAPDFENPADDGADNVYDVQVTVTDSGPGAPLTDTQDIAVTVLDVNEAPEITSDGGGDTATINIDENTTAVTDVETTDAEDSEGAGLTYSLTGGADAAKFSLDTNSGVLAFIAAPDFENPTDDGADNVYDVQVTVTDSGPGAPLTDVQDIAVTVVNVNDGPPEITSDGGGDTAAVDVDENTTAVTDVESTDPDDSEGSGLTYSLTGGADAALFSVDTNTGVLTFSSAPDFENPADAGGDNVYDVQVTVTDSGPGAPLTDTQDIAVTVVNVNEPPVITSNGGGATAAVSIDENTTAVTDVETTDAEDSEGAGLTYSLTGGADAAKFSLDTNTGVLAFIAAPDFENPTDVGADNVYDVQVTVTDSGPGGSLTDVQDIAVTVIDVAVENLPPEIISSDSPSVPENQTGVIDVQSTDDNDSEGAGLTYSLTGGADAAFFGLDTNTGVLTFLAPPDFENPMDSGGDNDYQVQVTVTDSGPGGNLTDVQDITVSVTSVNEKPVAADQPYNATGNVRINVPAVSGLLVSASDPDGDGMTVNGVSGVSAGAIVTFNANGSFTYTPPAGFTGDDTFSYTLIDDGLGTLVSDPATVTVTVADVIWFIDNTAAAGDGRLATPFNTLAAFEAVNGNGGANDPEAGDDIFVYAGSGSYSGGVTLENSQQLIGQGTTDTSLAVALGITLAPGSDPLPSINGTRPVLGPTGTAVVLASGDTVRGLDVSVTGGSQGLVGSGFGTATIDEIAITTETGTALTLNNGNATATIDSITSTSAGGNSAIVLINTGAGAITVSGGTIANKTVDAITFNDTDGPITLENMIIQDIGDLGGGFNTRSQDDAIHGQTVSGGLTLDGVTIRRISDMCVNGALFTDGISATTWNGLDILNSTIEDCNRWHVAGTGDTSDEGAVRIVGLTGTVDVDNSIIQRAGELMDLYTTPTGTLNMTVTNSNFEDAFKEFTSGTTVAIGKFCIDVTVEGDSDANVTIGGAGTFPNNEFINCGTASVRVSKDTVPAGTSDIEVTIDNNSFRVTDQTPANGIFGNTPQGGVALRAGPGGIDTFDAIVSNNTFGVAVGPDDDIGSTTDEVANADGVEGNVALIFESGVSQARVNNNTFNGSINAPWFNRADGNTSAAVLYRDNAYRGRSDYCCDGGFTFRVPGIPYRSRVRNNGNLDITLENDQFAVHDQFFFALTETIEFESRVVGGNMCVAVDGATSPDGFEFDELIGTINLYQGAVNNAVTGPCTAGASGDCQAELADDGVRGGPNGYTQAGTPNPSLNPPFVDVDNGSIAITGTACTLPSGGIF